MFQLVNDNPNGASDTNIKLGFFTKPANIEQQVFQTFPDMSVCYNL